MPQTIVVLTPNWLGDAVMALPALAAVRRHHGAHTLVVAARPVNRRALSHSNT